MAVVGFDFGNESCVIACIRRSLIEVIQNESGSRKTATCVGFSSNQRLIAGDGIASLNSNYKNSILPIKRLLGRKANDQFFEQEKMFLTTKITNEKEGMMVNVKYNSKDCKFTPESLCAMQLGSLKRTAEKKLGTVVKDCVIGVPAYWNDQQRRAMINSAKICGLNVMRLMNETTAVALNYGILRQIKTDIKVLFVDMGYSSLNVSLVSFGKGKLQVLATAADPNLGGRNFDVALMEHFAAYIKNKYKMDVLSNPKAVLKLRKECNRVKKTLSANKSVRFIVEYIMNDTDVKGEVTRSEFEKMCASLIERITAPLNEVLSIAKVQKNEIQSLEIVGGSVRIPMVRAKLKEWFNGKNLSATCDGDESVARGCALQCAMLAPFVKVRDFEVNDITPYGIQLYWQPYKQNDNRSLAEIWSEDCTNSPVPALNPIPSKKIISFKDKTEPFQVIAKYNDESKLPPDTEPFLGRWIISNIPPTTHPSNSGKPPKIKVKFQLDINGVFSVCHAQSIESYEIEVEEEVKVEIKPEEEPEMDVDSSPDKKKAKKENADNDPDKKSDSAKNNSAKKNEAAKDEAVSAEDATITTGTTTNATTTKASTTDEASKDEASKDEASKDEASKDEASKDEASKDEATKETPKDGAKDEDKKDETKETKTETKEEKPKKVEKPKPKYRMEKIKKMKSKKDKIEIPIQQQFVVQLSDALLEHCKKEEIKMGKLDMEIRETNELRNSLEGYVLEMRGKLEGGELSAYMNDGARQNFIKELNDMEEWLYEDGYDAEKVAFEERLKNLKLTGDPVDRRSNEAKRRPEFIKLLNRTVAEGKALADTKDKKFDHISKEDRSKAIKNCEEAEKWLTSELKKQDPLSLADDPVVLCETIERKAKETKEYCASIMNKPKPKPKKEKKPKSENKEKDQDKKNKSTDDMQDIEKENLSNEKTEKNQPNQTDSLEDDPLMDLGCD